MTCLGIFQKKNTIVTDTITAHNLGYVRADIIVRLKTCMDINVYSFRHAVWDLDTGSLLVVHRHRIPINVLFLQKTGPVIVIITVLRKEWYYLPHLEGS